MNVEQALAASRDRLACRVTGGRRVIVERSSNLLLLLVQARRRRRWVIDDPGGGMRYLGGVLRDEAGRYLCADGYMVDLDRVRACLPARDQELFQPACDDWLPVEREKVCVAAR